MQKIFSRYATPFITGLFLVSLISGVFLFLHIGTAYFHEMHEILSMVLIIPFVLHLWRNWKPMTAYVRQSAMGIAMAISIALAVAFAVPAMLSDSGGSPQRAIFSMMENGSLEAIAALNRTEVEALSNRLTEAGFTVPAASSTLAEIAAASGKSAFDVIGAVASK